MTKVEKLEALREYATENQVKILDRLIVHGGSKYAVARELGINESTVRRYLKRIQHQAAKMGYAPEAGLTHKAQQDSL